jgi:hypothetical protein
VNDNPDVILFFKVRQIIRHLAPADKVDDTCIYWTFAGNRVEVLFDSGLEKITTNECEASFSDKLNLLTFSKGDPSILGKYILN